MDDLAGEGAVLSRMLRSSEEDARRSGFIPHNGVSVSGQRVAVDHVDIAPLRANIQVERICWHMKLQKPVLMSANLKKDR
jgi:hypothetical protein